MATECKNCKADPSADMTAALFRINPFGITGEWICKRCLDDLLETFEDKPHYMHSPECPNYCDYCCNGTEGFDIADQIREHLNAPNNKSENINGRLIQVVDVWKIQSGYGTFPLSKELQTKPDATANGAWCSAKVLHGEVVEYHFASEGV